MKVKIKETVKDKGLAEIYQSMGTQMALVRRISDTKFEKISPFVKCRDFLVDSYSFSTVKKDFGIYGFSFEGSTEPLDWDACRLLVKFQGDETRALFDKQFLPLVHQIEKANNFDTLSSVLECDMKNCVVVIADKRWLQNCLHFSMYCLFPRIACYDVKADPNNVEKWLAAMGKVSASDGKYVESIDKKTWHRLCTSLKDLETENFCGFDPATAYVGTIHHNSGFISVFGSHTEISYSTVKENTHWGLMKERGFVMHPKTLAA